MKKQRPKLMFLTQASMKEGNNHWFYNQGRQEEGCPHWVSFQINSMNSMEWWSVELFTFLIVGSKRLIWIVVSAKFQGHYTSSL